MDLQKDILATHYSLTERVARKEINSHALSLPEIIRWNAKQDASVSGMWYTTTVELERAALDISILLKLYIKIFNTELEIGRKSNDY